jgi:hypothetical protein
MKPYKMQPKDYLLTLLFLIVFVGSSLGQQQKEKAVLTDNLLVAFCKVS